MPPTPGPSDADAQLLIPPLPEPAPRAPSLVKEIVHELRAARDFERLTRGRFWAETHVFLGLFMLAYPVLWLALVHPLLGFEDDLRRRGFSLLQADLIIYAPFVILLFGGLFWLNHAILQRLWGPSHSRWKRGGNDWKDAVFYGLLIIAMFLIFIQGGAFDNPMIRAVPVAVVGVSFGYAGLRHRDPYEGAIGVIGIVAYAIVVGLRLDLLAVVICVWVLLQLATLGLGLLRLHHLRGTGA